MLRTVKKELDFICSIFLWAHKNDVHMQNCNRLNRLDLVREKRPGTAYDVSALELANKEVLSSTISLRLPVTIHYTRCTLEINKNL